MNVEIVALVGAIATMVGGVAGGYIGFWLRGYREKPEELEARLYESEEEGYEAVLPAPDTGSSWLSLLKLNQHRKKEKKLARRGYVKWYKFDGMLSRPRWVKPERSGSGVAKYYDDDDDCHYLFPEDALVTDSQTGAPVAVHHSGEVEPVNLSEPEYPPIDADRLEEIINLEIESEPPSWLSKFDLDGSTMMWAGILIVLLFAGAQQVM